MKVSTETNQIVKSDWASQSKNQMVSVHTDLERIEDLHQIRISLVSLTRRMTGNIDSTRQMALVEVIKALSNLERAQDHIRSAQTN